MKLLVFLLSLVVLVNISSDKANAAQDGCVNTWVPCPEMAGPCPPGTEWAQVIGVPITYCHTYPCSCKAYPLGSYGAGGDSFVSGGDLMNIGLSSGTTVSTFQVGQTFDLNTVSTIKTNRFLIPALDVISVGGKQLIITK